MKEVVKEQLPKLNEVYFTVSAPEAKEVFLVGDFNNWATDTNSRMEAKNGAWRKKVSLNPGKYHYRFVIDGKWTEDAANPSKEVNPYGTMDSLIEVGLKKS
jgi:1,4-alpha-glucan branching enzyme